MAVETLAQGDSLTLSAVDDVEDLLIEVTDGVEAFLTPNEEVAPESGDRIVPGERASIEPRKGREEVLRAVGDDLDFQWLRQGTASSSERIRRLFKESQPDGKGFSVTGWNAGPIPIRGNQPTVAQGAQTVAAPGTAEALNDGTEQLVPDGFDVLVQGQVASSDDSVYVGNGSVGSADGYPLADGQPARFGVDDVAALFVDADTADDGVHWVVEADS